MTWICMEYVYTVCICQTVITWLMKHQVRKRPDRHTHKFNNLPPHTEAGIRIIKREKWNSFTLAEQYDLSISIHFKSGVIWVSRQRSPSHAPHPQPQVELWQGISHAPTVLLQSAAYSTNTVITRLLANFSSHLFAVPWGQLHLLRCSAGSPECWRWLPAQHFGVHWGVPRRRSQWCERL